MKGLSIRFSVRTLFFSVAVVAANLWAFRRFFHTDIYRVGGVLYRMLPAEIGMLPLFNVAVIGSYTFATKRYQSLRCGGVMNPRPTIPGVAYFSLQFLLLGWLLSRYMPEEIQRLQLSLDDITGSAAGSWKAMFGDPHGSIPWVIFITLVFGVFVSGPLLLISWVGQMLASRSAASLSRLRFRVMSSLVSLGFASAALAICLMPQVFVDEVDVVIDIHLVDEVTGRPVSGAFVCITDPFWNYPPSSPPRALTENNGRAKLIDRFVFRGERNAFRTFGLVSPWGRWLQITAAGFGTRRISLIEVLGQSVDPVVLKPHTIVLAPGEPRANSFDDLAGVYTEGSRGFGSNWFEIEPDGRFAWCASGCTYICKEFGYLKRRGKTLELIAIPNPWENANPSMAIEHRLIEWGDRLYILPEDQDSLRAFCRAALTQNRLSISDCVGGAFLRDSDRDRLRHGWPRLPLKVWTRFLLGELNFSDKDGLLRLALDYLFMRIPRADP